MSFWVVIVMPWVLKGMGTWLQLATLKSLNLFIYNRFSSDHQPVLKVVTFKSRYFDSLYLYHDSVTTLFICNFECVILALGIGTWIKALTSFETWPFLFQRHLSYEESETVVKHSKLFTGSLLLEIVYLVPHFLCKRSVSILHTFPCITFPFLYCQIIVLKGLVIKGGCGFISRISVLRIF